MAEDKKEELLEIINTMSYVGRINIWHYHTWWVEKTKQIFTYLKERVIKKVQGWKGRFLSQAGRQVLTKSVL